MHSHEALEALTQGCAAPWGTGFCIPARPWSPQLPPVSLLPTRLVCITQLSTVGLESVTSTRGEGVGMQGLHPLCSIQGQPVLLPCSVEMRCLLRPLGPAQECGPSCSRSFYTLPLPVPGPKGDVQGVQLSELRGARSTCGKSHWHEGLLTDAYGGNTGLGQ